MGEVGDFWSSKIFSSSNLIGRIFFSLPNALQDIFPLLISLQVFFPQKSVVFTFTECSYIYIVVIAVIVLIWSCRKRMTFSLYGMSIEKTLIYSSEQANTFHPTLKFTAEISEKEITFLDTVVYKGERFLKDAILDIKTHYNPTETFQYTEYWGGSRI